LGSFRPFFLCKCANGSAVSAVVAIAISDRAQLALMHAAPASRSRHPGILFATLANRARRLGGCRNRGVVSAETALDFRDLHRRGRWCLIPDKADNGPQAAHQAGAFLATLVAFFIVEIGDKTQIATVALAARFNALVAVTAGTTLGMLLANAPVVLFGDAIARRLPSRVRAAAIIRGAGATLYAVFRWACGSLRPADQQRVSPSPANRAVAPAAADGTAALRPVSPTPKPSIASRSPRSVRPAAAAACSKPGSSSTGTSEPATTSARSVGKVRDYGRRAAALRRNRPAAIARP
jgi:putative Ca2+/H+ antiporter (TMEM165/GDT1 family)